MTTIHQRGWFRFYVARNIPSIPVAQINILSQYIARPLRGFRVYLLIIIIVVNRIVNTNERARMIDKSSFVIHRIKSIQYKIDEQMRMSFWFHEIESGMFRQFHIIYWLRLKRHSERNCATTITMRCRTPTTHIQQCAFNSIDWVVIRFARRVDVSKNALAHIKSCSGECWGLRTAWMPEFEIPTCRTWCWICYTSILHRRFVQVHSE